VEEDVDEDETAVVGTRVEVDVAGVVVEVRGSGAVVGARLVSPTAPVVVSGLVVPAVSVVVLAPVVAPVAVPVVVSALPAPVVPLVACVLPASVVVAAALGSVVVGAAMSVLVVVTAISALVVWMLLLPVVDDIGVIPVVVPGSAVVVCVVVLVVVGTTVVVEGPLDTTTLTAEYANTSEPAAGFWLMMRPAGAELVATVCVPRVRFTPCSDPAAAPSVSPRILGTATGGPTETTTLIGRPGATLWPAVGLWLRTMPKTPLLLTNVCVPSVKFAPTKIFVAIATGLPTTLGTVVEGGTGPLETTTLTVEPATTLVPARGS
jgi:hypothetical protein